MLAIFLQFLKRSTELILTSLEEENNIKKNKRKVKKTILSFFI